MFAQRLNAFDFDVIGWLVGSVLASAAAGLLIAAQPIAALNVAVIAACAVLIAKWPYAALLLLLLVRGGVAASPSGSLIDLLALSAGGLAVLASMRSLPGRRVALPFVAFLLVALPSVPVLPSWDEGAKELWLRLPLVHLEYLRTPSNELLSWLGLAAALPVFALAASTVRTPHRLRTVVTVVLLAASYPVCVGLRQIATGDTHVRGGGFGSVEGPFTHPNGFASFLMIMMLVAIVAFFEYRALWPRLGLLLLLGGGMLCLMLTYTRAAWVGFAIGVVLLGCMRYRRLLLLGLVAVLVASFAAPGATKRGEQRFNDLSSGSQSYSANSWSWRTKQWKRMVPYGLKRPVLGRGFGSYERDTLAVFGTQDLQFSTAPRTPHEQLGFGAHNDYVKALVETGVIGFALWVLTLSGVVSVAARARRLSELAPWATAIFAAGISLSLVSLADNVQTASADLVYLFGLTGALAGASFRIRPGAAPVKEPAPSDAKAAATLESSVGAPLPEPTRHRNPEPGASLAKLDVRSARSLIGGWIRRRRR